MKRVFDLLLVVCSLPLLLPILLIVGCAIRLRLGAPVLFQQKRPGKNGEIFVLQKFRSMNDSRDAHGELLPDNERVTKFGSFLRSTSLDELPSLWNVICGEMSLVGPRPLLVEYLPRYTQEQMRRHEVLPGITGWAQIHGRRQLRFSERITLDIWYVDNQSFILDCLIIARTLINSSDRLHAHQHISEVDDLPTPKRKNLLLETDEINKKVA
jgi:lipopolysaccharide/colanic/teichoic acid biosynthesis glycosyltransferase